MFTKVFTDCLKLALLPEKRAVFPCNIYYSTSDPVSRRYAAGSPSENLLDMFTVRGSMANNGIFVTDSQVDFNDDTMSTYSQPSNINITRGSFTSSVNNDVVTCSVVYTITNTGTTDVTLYKFGSNIRIRGSATKDAIVGTTSYIYPLGFIIDFDDPFIVPASSSAVVELEIHN